MEHAASSTFVLLSQLEICRIDRAEDVFATCLSQALQLAFTHLSLCPDCRRQKAALKIQTAWRRSVARRRWVGFRRATVALQCCWRSKLARRELRKRRAAAREAGKLLKASGTAHCACSFSGCQTSISVLINERLSEDSLLHCLFEGQFKVILAATAREVLLLGMWY